MNNKETLVKEYKAVTCSTCAKPVNYMALRTPRDKEEYALTKNCQPCIDKQYPDDRDLPGADRYGYDEPYHGSDTMERRVQQHRHAPREKLRQ